MEKRIVARSLIRLIQPLQPDFVLLGADANDVLNALSYHYLHPHLAFKQAPIMPTMTAPRPRSSNAPNHRREHQEGYSNQQTNHHSPHTGGPQRHIPTTSVPLTIMEDASAETEPKDAAAPIDDTLTIIDVQDDAVHHQHQQVDKPTEMKHARTNSQLTTISALTDTDNYLTNGSRLPPHIALESDQLSQSAGGNYEDDDDFIIAEEDVSAVGDSVDAGGLDAEPAMILGGDDASSSQLPVHAHNHPKVAASQSPAVGNKTNQGETKAAANDDKLESSLDYNDLESFIIEDNDEGENSLSASPFLHARYVPVHATASLPAAPAVPNPSTNPQPSYQSQAPATNPADLILRLQLFRDFSRYSISFSDILLHELSTRPYWWTEYIADEVEQRQRRALSMNPEDASDPSIIAAKQWVHEPVSCILTHLSANPSSTQPPTAWMSSTTKSE